MAGSNLFVVSGIDGKFDDFDMLVGNSLSPYTRLAYIMTNSFLENCECMRKVIDSNISENAVILGWSIGAATALALSSICSIERCIMINSFFDRNDVLDKRGIKYDAHDNIVINSFRISNKSILIVSGYLDYKVPYCESLKCLEYLRNNNQVSLFIEASATHSLLSFSQDTTILLQQHITRETHT